jgi:hypothetical protein
MDTNFNNNIENQNETEQTNSFWHGGWGFVIFFIGLTGVVVAISYFVKWLF